MTERRFQQQVENMAGFYGWKAFHAPDNRPVKTATGRVIKQRISPGWPDLVLCRPPEILAVELKTDKGRVRPEQITWLGTLEACGVETHIWRPRNFDQLQARLARPAGQVTEAA